MGGKFSSTAWRLSRAMVSSKYLDAHEPHYPMEVGDETDHRGHRERQKRGPPIRPGRTCWADEGEQNGYRRA